MKKVNSFWSAALAIVVAAGLAMPLYAASDEQAGSGRKSAHYRRAGGAPLISIALRHQSELNLTADQIAKLEETKTHYQNQTAPLFEQLKSVEQEIANLAQETPANLIELKLKIQEAEKLRSELRYLRLEALDNGKSMLSEEQRAQLRNLITTRRGEHRKRHGRAEQPS